ncbi:SDR family oxidoreductase [Zwartia sp.]|uniref:SDR family oxidoreductase n=1 Tax=Zwartia sp. TaxID=2978004 RepID=UPI00272429B2|nr:SDR family oxidoreductase [Zwartia sp.]MDO9024510.1 SDR family oxidoreductase [Zwartia sp.]
MKASIPDAPVVLITGAGNGIGKSIALGLLSKGMRIAAVDRDEQSLLALKQLSNQTKHCGHLEIFAEDLTRFDAVSLVSRIENNLGGISILINNAGLGQGQIRSDYHRHPPKFYDVTQEQWMNAMAVNANAVFLLSQAVTKHMLVDGWGRIINITTSLGTMLRGGYCPYGPTKAAAEGLSAVMASDLHGTGTTVNVLIPGGIVNTPMIPGDAPFFREQLIQPEAMLAPLYWLCSQEANDVTGLRFLANKWNETLPAAEAAKLASAPIGWKDIAVLPVTPEFIS